MCWCKLINLALSPSGGAITPPQPSHLHSTMARSSIKRQMFCLSIICILSNLWLASQHGIFDNHMPPHLTHLDFVPTAGNDIHTDSYWRLEHRATLLALSVANHSVSDPWISLWRKVQGTTLSAACLPRLDSEKDESRFLMRNSIFEVTVQDDHSMLCTVTNGYEFALRYRLDEVQHPRPGRFPSQEGQKEGEATNNDSKLNLSEEKPHPDIEKWRYIATVAKSEAPSCQFAGTIDIPPVVSQEVNDFCTAITDTMIL